MTTPGHSRALACALRRYTGAAEAMRLAEADYRHVVASESPSTPGKAKGKSRKRIDEAFDALVDAVVELQRSRHNVTVIAEGEGLTLASLGAAAPACEAAEREYAGYLAARTYSQVRQLIER